jgi:hypothetical protein
MSGFPSEIRIPAKDEALLVWDTSSCGMGMEVIKLPSATSNWRGTYSLRRRSPPCQENLVVTRVSTQLSAPPLAFCGVCGGEYMSDFIHHRETPQDVRGGTESTNHLRTSPKILIQTKSDCA